jgi:PST family polysaccharide transporter
MPVSSQDRNPDAPRREDHAPADAVRNGLSDPTPPPAPGDAAAPASERPIQELGRIVGKGMALMVVATIATKVGTMLAQWVLGATLKPEDFAVYAYATAIAGFTMVCREAGVRELMIQRGEKHYEDLAGPGFWLALVYNLVVTALMVGVAFPLAWALNLPTLAPMLIVIALAIPVGTVAGIIQTSMRIHLRFADFAINNVIGSLTRQGSIMALALAGVGAMSQAWPVLMGTVVESASAFLRSRDAVWKRPAQPHRWGGILRQSRWLMFASVANFAVDYGPFLLMGAVTALSQVQSGPLYRLGQAFQLTNEEAGYFYFAFMITAQVGVLLSFNLSLVLTPALARLYDDTPRLASGVLRSLRTLMLMGSLGSLGLASVIHPLELLLWNGKWADAMLAVVILGIFFPWRITFGVSSSLLQAQGRFRLYAVLTAVEGGGITLFTIIGALVHPTATSMAAWAGGWLLVSRLGLTIWVLRSIGVGTGDVLRSTFPAWIVAVVAGALGFWCGEVLDALPVFKAMHPRVAILIILCIAGSVCTGTFALICRVALRPHLEDLVAVAPLRLRRPLARVMLLSAE